MFAAYSVDSKREETPCNSSDSNNVLPKATSFPPSYPLDEKPNSEIFFVTETRISDATAQLQSTRQKSHSSDEEKCSSRSKSKKKSKKKHKKASPERRSTLSELVVFSGNEKYFLDVKAEKSNLFSCPYLNSEKRYYALRGVLGDESRKYKSSKKESNKKSRYFGKSNRKCLGDAIEVTESSVSSTAEETLNLHERLKTNPDDVEVWLKFINSQHIKASDVFESEEEGKVSKKTHFRALIERKLSIVAKALEHNPKSVELISCKLELLYQLGSSVTLHQEWQNALFVHPTSLSLWREYLTFMKRNFEDFTVKRSLKAYSSCLTKLYQIQLPSFKSHAKPKDVENCMIDIISEQGYFLHSAGWTELCISIFQAFAEICLNRSGDVSLNGLDTWWNSSSPRIGENALGGEQLRKVHGCDSGDIEDGILVDKGNDFSNAWLALENLRSQEHWQACSNEDDSEDVERYVKFADVQPYLFPVANNEHLHFRLLTGLLQSLGIPLAPANQAQMFWAPVMAENNLTFCLSAVVASALPPSNAPTLLSSPSYLNFVREIFAQLWLKLKHPYGLDLILWWFAVEKNLIISKRSTVEFSSHWKTTKNWTRNFLKKVPPNETASSVLLYTAYAAILVEAGEHKEARRVLQTILEHNSANPLLLEASKMPFNLRSALLQCWFELIRSILLDPSEKSQKIAINLLVKLSSGLAFNAELREATPAVILKAKRKFETILSEMQVTRQRNHVLFHEPEELTIILGCSSVLLSLVEGCASAFNQVMNWLNESRKALDFSPENRFNVTFLRYHTQRELAYVNLLHLLNYSRSWVRDYNPKFFHDALNSGLNEYSNSWQLLTIVIQSDMVGCNTFSHFWRNLVLRAKSVKSEAEIPIIFAVLLILVRWEKTVSQSEFEVDATALSFSRRREHLAEFCVENTLACHVPFVWRLLVHQIHKNGDSRHCLSLLYRAIKECPWSKDLYVDIVRCSPTNLEEAASLLSEKELRLRLPVEELRVLLESQQEAMDS